METVPTDNLADDNEFQDAVGPVLTPEEMEAMVEKVDQSFVAKVKEQDSNQGLSEETSREDPPERNCLPYLKGQNNVKVSMWSILKESIGKEIWKITVPVVFNEPLNVLQKCAGVTEYIDILDQALAEPDEMKRFALVALQFATQYQNVERSGLSKPFNPMLGETFEYVVPGKYKYLAEQVSHHPPITAFVVLGDSGFVKYSTF